MTSVTNRASAYSYDLAGNRIGEQIETNGYALLVSKSGYNGLNQVTNRAGTGALPVQFVGTVNEFAAVAVSNVSATVLPDVDSTNRLFTAAVNLPSGSNGFSISATDVNGNHTVSNYTLNVTGNSAKTYAYDLNGNCTNVSTPGTNTTYEWDAEDRLAAVDIYITNTATLQRTLFTYDGLDRWVQMIDETNGTVFSTKRFVWCGTELCQERNSTNGVTRSFFKEGEQVAGANYYFLRNELGSVREVTDTNQNVVARYDYDPYGRTTRLSGTWNSDADFQFDGYYYHAPIGLNLAVFRAYDPDSSRWLNRDPIQEMGGLNLYAYVANDPIANMDPLGLAWYDGIAALTGFGGQGTFSAAWGGFAEGWSKGGQGVVNDFTGGLFNSENGLFYNSFDKQDQSAFGSGIKCDSAFKFGSNAGRVAEAALLAAGALQAAGLGNTPLFGPKPINLPNGWVQTGPNTWEGTIDVDVPEPVPAPRGPLGPPPPTWDRPFPPPNAGPGTPPWSNN